MSTAITACVVDGWSVTEGILNASDVRATVARRRHGAVSRGSTSHHLTEDGAILVTSRSNTKVAHAITRARSDPAAHRGQSGGSR